MPVEDGIFNEALAAIDLGDRARARDLLTRLLKSNQGNAQYWLWMSSVVDTLKERIYCLKEAYKLDPQDEAVRRGLILAGAPPPGTQPAAPVSIRRAWQPQVSGAQPASTGRGRQALLLIGGVLALALIVFLGLSGTRWLGRRAAQVQRLPTVAGTVVSSKPSAAPLVAASPSAEVARQSATPQPLWMLLAATYTPRPLYVNTSHPRVEAFRLGQRAMERSDWSAAVNYFEQAATVEPESADVLYWEGESYRLQQQLPQAETAYNMALSKNGRFAPARLGLALVELSRRPKGSALAETFLRQAIQDDPGLGDAYLVLAKLALLKGDPKTALGTLEQGGAQFDTLPQFYFIRAQAYLLQGELEKAEADARRANELDSTDLDSYALLGSVLVEASKYPAALEALNTYLRYRPDDVDALLQAARANDQTKHADEAMLAVDRVIALNPDLLEAYLLRADINLERQASQKAQVDYEQALRLAPNLFAANLGKGRALLMLGYNGDAYMQLSRSEGLAASPAEKASVFYYRALSLEGLQERDPKSAAAAMHDWNALLDLPAGSAPQEWLETASRHIPALYTATATAVPSHTPTQTRTPLYRITAAPTATRTPTPTALPPTLTRKP